MAPLNTSTSIVDYLKSIGQDSSMGSRAKVAKDYGITNYSGTAGQNTQLLNAMKGTKPTVAPSVVPSVQPTVQPAVQPTQVTSQTVAQLGETDDYGIDKIREEQNTYKKSAETAMNNLKKVQSETYDSEYKKRNLGAKKNQISSIDAQINAEKAKRDEAINKIRNNPGLSAAQMSGQIKKAADYQNDVINNLIGQRNATASEYNNELDEIGNIVGQRAKEAEMEFNYYTGLLGRSDDMVSEYQKQLQQTLLQNQEQENWEKQLAQALTIAQMKDSGGGSDKMTLVRNPQTGEPSYWYNPITQEIRPAQPVTTETTDPAEETFESLDEERKNASNVPRTGFLSKAWFNNLLGRNK